MCGGHTTSCLLAVVDGRGLVLDASWIVLNIENAAITDRVLFLHYPLSFAISFWFKVP